MYLARPRPNHMDIYYSGTAVYSYSPLLREEKKELVNLTTAGSYLYYRRTVRQKITLLSREIQA